MDNAHGRELHYSNTA